MMEWWSGGVVEFWSGGMMEWWLIAESSLQYSNTPVLHHSRFFITGAGTQFAAGQKLCEEIKYWAI